MPLPERGGSEEVRAYLGEESKRFLCHILFEYLRDDYECFVGL
jgi:hypothetical protein